MNGSDSAQLIYALLLLMLLLGSLFARRLPMKQVARHGLLWVALFAAMFVLFSFREQFRAGWATITGEFSPGGTNRGGVVRLRKDEDGHFSANVRMNGRDVRMLVDSGATTTSISSETAKSAGIDVDRSAFPVIVNTANGAAESYRARVQDLDVVGIKRSDFPIHVSDTLGDTDLLGMNFLSTLKSWRVEGNEMILEP